jgi:alpha-amylase
MEQVHLQEKLLMETFGVKPISFCNTEIIYSDEMGEWLGNAGYRVILTEGARHILGWKSPTYLYCNPYQTDVRLLLRSYQLCDDITLRFADQGWDQYPLTAGKYIRFLENINTESESPLINLYWDYETIGEHYTAETGIFDFLKAVPYFAIEQSVGFLTPSEAGKKLHSNHLISSPYPLTWAGEAKDLSTFTGNDLQQEALRQLYSVAERVRLCADVTLRRDWLLLQDVTYMSDMQYTSGGRNGFESPYDAFINYTNILSDFLQRVEEQYPTSIENEELTGLLKTIHNQELEIAELKRKRRTPKDQKKTV